VKTLLLVRFAVEVLAGLAFALFPSSLFVILLGVPLDASGAYAFRMFGAAIFAMGFACWLARDASDTSAAKALIMATLLYDAVFVALLLSARLAAGLAGIALWPTVLLHSVLAIYSLLQLRSSLPALRTG
jgi:hypothetical protein